jgi:hypothetical protein
MCSKVSMLTLIAIFFLTTSSKYNSMLVEARFRSTLLPVDLLGKTIFKIE